MANDQATGAQAGTVKVPASGTTWARTGLVAGAVYIGPDSIQPIVHRFDEITFAIWPALGMPDAAYELSISKLLLMAGTAAVCYFMRGRVPAQPTEVRT